VRRWNKVLWMTYNVIIARGQWVWIKHDCMTLYFCKVYEVVAAPVERQTASVWLSSSKCSTRGKVCYVQLPWIFWHDHFSSLHFMQSKISSHLNHYHHLLIAKFMMNVTLPLEICQSYNSVNVYMIRYRVHVYHAHPMLFPPAHNYHNNDAILMSFRSK